MTNPTKPDTLTIRNDRGRSVAVLALRNDRRANRVVGDLAVSGGCTAESGRGGRRPTLGITHQTQEPSP